MKRKLTIGSIFAAAILVLVSFISVVGYQSAQANEKESSSPLFTVRTQRATQKTSEGFISAFLGKGKQLNIFPSRKSQNEDMINKAIIFFSTNPALLNRLLDSLDQFPYLAGLINKYGINKLNIKNYMKIIKNNPLRLAEEMNDIKILVPHENSPQPLGLSTSNPLGCFIITLVALVPITVVLTLLLLLFTVRIFTCLNVNDCANNIAEEIWTQLLQGLTPG
jgi:hypothetical protein